MKIIKDKKEIEKIIDFNKRLKLRGFRVFNTPWAKNKVTGKKDFVNVALFIEFENNGDVFWWLLSEKEFKSLNGSFKEVSEYNKKFNGQGVLYNYWYHYYRDEVKKL